METIHTLTTGSPVKNRARARGMPGSRKMPARMKHSDVPARMIRSDGEVGPKTRCRDGTTDVRIRDGTVIHTRDGTTDVRVRDGTLLEIPVCRKSRYNGTTDVRIRDGTVIHPRDGTTDVRVRDGTIMDIFVCRTGRRYGIFLREKIPKPPDLKRTGAGEMYALNNLIKGLKGSGMEEDGRRKHEDGSPIEFKTSFGKERIEKPNYNSVVLCESSVNSVVKNEELME